MRLPPPGCWPCCPDPMGGRRWVPAEHRVAVCCLFLPAGRRQAAAQLT